MTSGIQLGFVTCARLTIVMQMMCYSSSSRNPGSVTGAKVRAGSILTVLITASIVSGRDTHRCLYRV